MENDKVETYDEVLNGIDKYVGAEYVNPETGEKVTATVMPTWAMSSSMIITICQALRGEKFETCPTAAEKILKNIIGNRKSPKNEDIFPLHFESVINYAMESIKIRQEMSK